MADDNEFGRRGIDREFTAHLAADAGRLDRIEQKIDKLAETVISLARAEEKLITLEEDRVTIHHNIEKIDIRISNIESRVTENELTIRVINRLFWIIVTAVASTGVGAYLITASNNAATAIPPL